MPPNATRIRRRFCHGIPPIAVSSEAPPPTTDGVITLFRFPPRRTTAGRCNRYRGRLFLGHRRRLDLQPRRPELAPRAPYAPQRAFSAPTCRRPAASVSLELKDVVGAVAGRTSEIRANRSKRSARPFLPPLIFFVIVSASPSSAQRLRVARIPVEQRHQAFPRVGIHRL
jgi:hypothetical protein